MNITLFVILLFALQGLYWFVGKRAAKNIEGKTDYFLAGKSVRLFPLMMTFLATQVGGGIILGSADEAYRYGWPVILYPLGAALGLILLGCGIGRKWARFPISTTAQIFDVVYKSPMLRKVASLLSIVSLFMILVAQIIASHKFLVSLGLTSIPLIIAFWAIVIFYTAHGGLKSVISTDVVQAVFFCLVFFACLGFVAFAHPISLAPIETFGVVSSKMSGWLLMPLLFMVIEQDMGQRCFAGSTPRVVSRACLLAGLGTMAVCVVPVFIGSLAHTLGLSIPPGGSVLMTAIATLTNPWMSALVGCAVLAAIISTATSLINAIGSNLSSDFSFSFLRNVNPVRLVRMLTYAISLAALCIAFQFNNIVDLLIQSYELSVSCLFVPICLALFKRSGSFHAALLSILFGAAGFFLFRMVPIPLPKEIASIILSFVGYGAGTLYARVTQRKGIVIRDRE